MASYISTTGLDIPSLQDSLDQMGAQQRSAIDPLLATDPDSVVGSGNGIYASQERELWEALEIVSTAFDPDQAEGSFLEAVCAITGTFRQPAYPSRFKGSRRLTLLVDPGGTVTAGVSKFGIPGTTIQFVATSSAVNATAGQVVFLIPAECTVNGPTHANAGTVTSILTPGTGIVSVTNVHDVILGAEIESDADLRLRRELEIRQSGSGVTSAIVADFLAIENDDGSKPVRTARLIDNTGDVPAMGVPAHSWQAVIWDGPGHDADDADLNDVVAANHVPGISSSWVRPAQDVLHITVNLKSSIAYVGDTAVKTALSDYVSTLIEPNAGGSTGTVAWSKIVAVVMALGGVVEVTGVTLALGADSPVSLTDVQPALRHIAVTDTTQIVVTSVAA